VYTSDLAFVEILLGEKLTASELKLHCDAWEILKNAALWTQKEAPEVARYMKENLRLQEENAEKTKVCKNLINIPLGSPQNIGTQ